MSRERQIDGSRVPGQLPGPRGQRNLLLRSGLTARAALQGDAKDGGKEQPKHDREP